MLVVFGDRNSNKTIRNCELYPYVFNSCKFLKTFTEIMRHSRRIDVFPTIVYIAALREFWFADILD